MMKLKNLFQDCLTTSDKNLNYHRWCSEHVHKVFAILKALVDGSTTIEYIDKTQILRTPGEVTIGNHN